MKNFLSRILIFISCFIIVVSLSSWGFYVHETATQLAVYNLPNPLRKFFFANIDSLTSNAIRPDKRRNTDKTEAAKHFIDIENYGNGAMLTMPHNLQTAVLKYSLDTLKKYGYVPYQILIEYDSLVNAFKHTNSDSIIFYADDLAHYIEDANVPLHTTNNYDGQLTDQKGLHALWESTIPELELSNYNLLSKHKTTYVKNKEEVVWTALRRAHALLPEMFMKEQEVAENFPDSSKYISKMYYGKMTKVYSNEFAKQYATALSSTINDQLNYCSDMVADFWYSAWVDAGKPKLTQLYKCTNKNSKELRKELRSYKKNNLLEDSLIRANKD
ncbi:MAG: hypothetical protein JO072_06175 [Parafilimonas sp.]|nr:hypothetical protein [Parafilimonas sp.]